MMLIFVVTFDVDVTLEKEIAIEGKKKNWNIPTCTDSQLVNRQ